MPMKSKCPICGKVINKATRQESRDKKFYPFCSNRCKLIDLGKWLDSKYRIATVEDDKNADDTATADAADKAKND